MIDELEYVYGSCDYTCVVSQAGILYFYTTACAVLESQMGQSILKPHSDHVR